MRLQVWHVSKCVQQCIMQYLNLPTQIVTAVDSD